MSKKERGRRANVVAPSLFSRQQELSHLGRQKSSSRLPGPFCRQFQTTKSAVYNPELSHPHIQQCTERHMDETLACACIEGIK